MLFPPFISLSSPSLFPFICRSETVREKRRWEMKRDGVRCKEKANGHSFPYSHAFSIWFLLYLYLVFPFFLLLPQILTSKIYCRTHSSLNPVNNVDENRTREWKIADMKGSGYTDPPSCFLCQWYDAIPLSFLRSILCSRYYSLANFTHSISPFLPSLSLLPVSPTLSQRLSTIHWLGREIKGWDKETGERE